MLEDECDGGVEGGSRMIERIAINSGVQIGGGGQREKWNEKYYKRGGEGGER